MSVQLCHVLLLVAMCTAMATAYFNPKNFDCGPYGFVCEGKSRLRLCQDDNLIGPAFRCPAGSICNDDSSDVCESAINYIDPSIRSVRCHRNERIADPSVPGCKGYILCIPNKNRFQGIKFKCSGDTIFNGYTRACSSQTRYKCPIINATKSSLDLFDDVQKPSDWSDDIRPSYNPTPTRHNVRPIDCKNYKLTLTQENSPAKATFFCPPRPTSYGSPTKCTVFSNHFCLILEKDDEDQFIQHAGAAYRRPRNHDESN